MKIFPHVLVRIGGNSFDQLASLDFGDLAAGTAQLLALRREKEAAKEAISAQLLAHIRGLTDARTQNLLQNLRRDLFNDRAARPAVLAEARELLPEPLRGELDHYLSSREALLLAAQELQRGYQRQVYRARRQLQTLAGDAQLQKGLVLSSQTLLDSLADYRQKDPGAFRKKEFQNEHSLLKYLTRMQAKTSPFSTFNNLALGELAPQAGAPLAFTGPADAGAVTGHIRLNNNLYKYLRDLMAAYRELYLRLPLRPNPTIQKEGGHFLYLTNHNNTEAFQRLPVNAVLGLLHELAGRERAGIRFDALVGEMQEYIDASAEELEKYLRQLVAYGFFEFDLGVSGIDPDWDLKLVAQLQPLAGEGVPHVAELIGCLRHVRALAGQYAGAEVAARKGLLGEAYAVFRGMCMQLHEAAGLPAQERRPPEVLLAERQAQLREMEKNNRKPAPAADAGVAVAEAGPGEAETATDPSAGEEAFRHESATVFAFRPEQMFFEDTTRPVQARLDASQLERFAGTVDALLRALHLFRGFADEQDRLRHFFLEKYGRHAVVNLLTFYEEYYREVKKPEADRQARLRKEALRKAREAAGDQAPSVPPNAGATEATAQETEQLVPAIAGRRAKAGDWNERYAAAIRPALLAGGDCVRLRLAEVQQANQALGIRPDPVADVNSYGMFVQFFQEPDAEGHLQLKGVLNAAFTGYGKMISRFLHILPGAVTADVRAWNLSLAGDDSLFVEDCDASYFNANLHPPLMPCEIRMPGGHNSLPPGQQLPITDFTVQYHPENEEIQLRHTPTGKRAYVFDLGFQGHGGRSQLFQLLEKFTRSVHVSPWPVTSAVNTHFGQEDPADGEKKVRVLPRIVYEDRVILKRKSWNVPRELIPLRKPHETDADYFVAVNEWRTALDIVDEVFIFVNPRTEQAPADPALRRKAGRDDYKPQYIHFNNPLLVNLFEKLAAKVPATLKIEEMLPHSGHLASIGGEKFVTEYVVQWYNQ